MNSEEVDVEKIMKEIKKQSFGEAMNFDSSEVLEKRTNKNCVECDIPTMEIIIKSLEMQTEMRCYDYINCNYRLQFYREIGNKSKIIKIVKRVIRKLIRFCVHPIVNDQSELNYNLLQVLMIQNDKINELKEEIDKIKKRKEQLQNTYKS